MFGRKQHGATPTTHISQVIDHQNQRRLRLGLPLIEEPPAWWQLTPGNRKRRQQWSRVS